MSLYLCSPRCLVYPGGTPACTPGTARIWQLHSPSHTVPGCASATDPCSGTRFQIRKITGSVLLSEIMQWWNFYTVKTVCLRAARCIWQRNKQTNYCICSIAITIITPYFNIRHLKQLHCFYLKTRRMFQLCF